MHAPVRVVIVDDHPAFRQVARDLFEHRGHVVVGEAECAAQALHVIADSCPDVVVLDVRLGDESGIDVACTLRGVHPDVAVILVSAAEAGAVDIVRCGVHGFVPKWRLSTVDLRSFLQRTQKAPRET
jgi:DNA-binding NarL/FixJ family response regulator